MVVVISYISNAIYYKEYFHTHTWQRNEHYDKLSSCVKYVLVVNVH